MLVFVFILKYIEVKQIKIEKNETKKGILFTGTVPDIGNIYNSLNILYWKYIFIAYNATIVCMKFDYCNCLN